MTRDSKLPIQEGGNLLPPVRAGERDRNRRRGRSTSQERAERRLSSGQRHISTVDFFSLRSLQGLSVVHKEVEKLRFNYYEQERRKKQSLY